MGLRQRQWAQNKRFELIFLLGGVCNGCGCRKNLQLDCITPQGDGHHKMELSHRMSFYWRQFREGNLQLLCAHRCHKAKSVEEYKAWAEKQENDNNCPF